MSSNNHAIEEFPSATAKILPWVISLLALVCFGSAFLGAESAGEFFSSPAMAMVWILILSASALMLILCVLRRYWLKSCLCLGICLIIGGGLWGSQMAISMTGSGEYPVIRSGKMLLTISEDTHDIYDIDSQNISQLPFAVRMNRCGAEFHGVPSIYYRRGDSIRVSPLSASVILDIEANKLEVIELVSWARPLYPSDMADGPMLECIYPDGRSSSCSIVPGESIKCESSGAIVKILQLSRKMDAFDSIAGDSNIYLKLSIAAQGTKQPSEHIIAPGEYLDVPDIYGEKLYYRSVEPIGIESSDSSDVLAWPYGIRLRVSDAASDFGHELVMFFSDYDLPLILAGSDQGQIGDVIISREKNEGVAQIWADFEIADTGKSSNYTAKVNKPMVYGGYRFYVSEPINGGSGMIVNVRSDRGRFIVYAGMFLLLIFLFGGSVERKSKYG